MPLILYNTINNESVKMNVCTLYLSKSFNDDIRQGGVCFPIIPMPEKAERSFTMRKLLAYLLMGWRSSHSENA